MFLLATQHWKSTPKQRINAEFTDEIETMEDHTMKPSLTVSSFAVMASESGEVLINPLYLASSETRGLRLQALPAIHEGAHQAADPNTSGHDAKTEADDIILDPYYLPVKRRHNPLHGRHDTGSSLSREGVSLRDSLHVLPEYLASLC